MHATIEAIEAAYPLSGEAEPIREAGNLLNLGKIDPFRLADSGMEFPAVRPKPAVYIILDSRQGA